MATSAPSDSIDKIKDRADELSVWVAQLRSGGPVPNLRCGKTDPLSRLSHQLQLLAETMREREREVRGLVDPVATAGSRPATRGHADAASGDASIDFGRDAEVRKLVDALIAARNRSFLQMLERNRQLLEKGESLSEIANRDALTGVLNRGAIMRVAERALRQAAVTQKPAGFIIADIDHFKSINDTFGHSAGDTALKEFTRRLAKAVRQSDQLGRYGGEEFMIIAAGPLTRNTLNKAAERLRLAIIASPFDLGSESRTISASFGAAIATGIGETAQDVVDAADRALYAAKNSGRNRVVVVGAANQEPG